MSYGIDGTRAFEPSLQYEYARRVNSVLLNFGNFLVGATSVAVWRPDRGEPPPSTSPVIALNETDSSGKAGAGTPHVGTYLLGLFASRCGPTGDSVKAKCHAVLIQNQRFDLQLWPTVKLRDGVMGSNVRELDASTGTMRPVRDDSPALPGLQMVLAPGSARLLVVGALPHGI